MNIIFIVNFEWYKKRTKGNIKTVGGIETNTRDVIKELQLRGHQVWNIEERPEEPEWVKKGQVDIIAAPTFDPITYLKIKKYRSKFSERAAVVIHAHTTVEDMKGNFIPDTDLFNNLLKLWLRIIYGTAHLVITPSGYSKECIINMQKSLTYPIHAVSNGIRLDRFKPDPNYKINFRDYLLEHHDIPKDAIVIVNVGLSWKKKGVDIFGNVAKALPDYYFVWVGPINSNNEDIDDARELDNVFFTGFYDVIQEPYYGADIFLNTSYNENQGIPLIEAAICKIPMVVSNLPAYDWVDHGVSCLKSPPNPRDVSGFVQNIEKLLQDNNLRNNIVEEAYKKAVHLHDFSKIGEKIENLYQKALLVKKIWDRKRQ